MKRYIIPICFFVYFIILIIMFLLLNKKHEKEILNIKNTKPKRRFRYLDTFYFELRREIDDGTYTKHYYVIEDVDSKKIYSIQSFNSNGRGKSNCNTGYFWIDEEMGKYYTENEEGKFIDGSKVIKMGEIKNDNKEYDSSLFEKTTYITGYLEFDK